MSSALANARLLHVAILWASCTVQGWLQSVHRKLLMNVRFQVFMVSVTHMTVNRVFTSCSDVSQEPINVDTIASPLEYYNDVLSLLVNNVWKCFTYTSQCSPGMDRKKHFLAAPEITVFNKMYDDSNTDIHCMEKQISFFILKQNQSFSSAFNPPHTNIFLSVNRKLRSLSSEMQYCVTANRCQYFRGTCCLHVQGSKTSWKI